MEVSSASPAFEAKDVTKEFDDGKVRALRGVTFRVDQGEFVSIMGTSGSGKTTLLQLLGALDTPTAGTLRYCGQPMAEIRDPAGFRAREIGFVFQAFHLLPTFTAVENVQIPMLESARGGSERRARALELLDAVGLAERRDHFPEKLSGGEKQRVAIARSLANEPNVLLADEPTGNLDSDNAQHVMELLNRIQGERNMTLILVTHDRNVASHAPRTLQVKDGQILADGRLQEHSAPPRS